MFNNNKKIKDKQNKHVRVEGFTGIRHTNARLIFGLLLICILLDFIYDNKVWKIICYLRAYNTFFLVSDFFFDFNITLLICVYPPFNIIFDFAYNSDNFIL